MESITTNSRTFFDWMRLLPTLKGNTIPPITHELGKHWNQPNLSEIKIDDEFAYMNKKTFDQLADYSHSQPSGVYHGKMWKASNSAPTKPTWCLCWFGYHENEKLCSVNYRIIVINI